MIHLCATFHQNPPAWLLVLSSLSSSPVTTQDEREVDDDVVSDDVDVEDGVNNDFQVEVGSKGVNDNNNNNTKN